MLFASLGRSSGIYAETLGPHHVRPEHRDPAADVRRRRLLLGRRAALPVAGALALQPDLLPRATPCATASSATSDVIVWLSLGVTAALAIPAYLVVPVAVHAAAQAEGAEALAELERRDRRAAARCPRLVEWREQVAREKRAAFRDEEYWGRPVPGLRRPARARVRARPRAGRARRQPHRPGVHRRPLGRLAVRVAAPDRASPTSRRPCARDDGLRLDGAFVAAAVRCAPPANKPLPAERDNCLPYAAEELELLRPVRVIVCLGGVRVGRRAAGCSALAPAAALRPRRRARDARTARCCSAATTRASRTPSPAS